MEFAWFYNKTDPIRYFEMIKSSQNTPEHRVMGLEKGGFRAQSRRLDNTALIENRFLKLAGMELMIHTMFG